MAGREDSHPAIGLSAALISLFLIGTCAPATSRPNLLLIVVDTLRADHLHSYGYPRETSPALDDLASRGVLFEKAISAAPWTLPSVMSLLTGRLPSSHRVENDGLRLSGSIPFLPEVLKKSGYATAAVVSHFYVDRPFGFDRGFDRFEDFGLSTNYRFEAQREPRASAVTDRALQEVETLSEGPFFLLVHYFDPHWDYAPPPPFDTRFGDPYRGNISGSYRSFSRYIAPGRDLAPEDRQHLLDLYDGEIAYTDAEIGRLLRELEKMGLAARTVVVVTSDHGEEFKEHGSLGHGQNLYDEVVRVPLIVADPRGAQRGRRVQDQVRTLDLFPTLLGWAGMAVPPGVAGESLEPLLEGESVGDRPAVTETIRFDAYRKSYRRTGEKLILSLESNRREYYDLASDPQERRNLWPDRSDRARALERDLFARVEVLSGGWNLRWTSDGQRHRFSGRVETDGLLTDLLPLFSEEGRLRVQQGRRIDFDLGGVTGSGGLSFRIDPPDARVAFSLAVDGVEDSRRVLIGRERLTPPFVPFSFAGRLRSEILQRPTLPLEPETVFLLWRNPTDSPGDRIELGEAMKERLRSLGYVR